MSEPDQKQKNFWLRKQTFAFTSKPRAKGVFTVFILGSWKFTSKKVPFKFFRLKNVPFFKLLFFVQLVLIPSTDKYRLMLLHWILQKIHYFSTPDWCSATHLMYLQVWIAYSMKYLFNTDSQSLNIKWKIQG